MSSFTLKSERLQSGNHRPSDMTIDIDGETELPLLCDMLR